MASASLFPGLFFAYATNGRTGARKIFSATVPSVIYIKVSGKFGRGTRLGLSIHHTAYMTAATYIHASTAQLQLYFVYSSRAVGIGCVHSSTMSTWTIWTVSTYLYMYMYLFYGLGLTYPGSFRPKLWCICSRDLTLVAVCLVVQVDFSKWKVTRCGQPTIHSTLDRRQRPSRWENHAITREQRLNSKI